MDADFKILTIALILSWFLETVIDFISFCQNRLSRFVFLAVKSMLIRG